MAGFLFRFIQILPGLMPDPSRSMDLDRILEELEQLDPRKCRMVELRFFLGFTAEETAELLNTSKATVDRELRFVRGWLYDRLHSA